MSDPKMRHSSIQPAPSRDLSTRHFVRKYFEGKNGFDTPTFNALLESSFDNIAHVFSELSYAAAPLLAGFFPTDWGSWRSVAKDPSTDDLASSLRWTTFKLRYHSEKLGAMVKRRDDIEQSILVGNLHNARTQLQSFNKTYGVSLWSLGTYFRLCELVNGTHFNKTELLRFTEQHRNKKRFYWSNCLAHYLSIAVEEGLSNTDYADTLNFLTVDAPDIGEYALTYLRYRLNSELPADPKALTDILHYESRHSLLDIYDSFSLIIAQRFSVDLPPDIYDPLFTLAADTSGVLAAICRQHDAYKDYVHPSTFDVCRKAANSAFLGDAATALKWAQQASHEFPHFFTAYDIAGQCIAQLDEKVSDVHFHSPVQQQLVSAISHWYSARGDRTHAIEELTRIGRFLSGTLLGWGIVDFVRRNDSAFDPALSDAISLLASPCPLPQQALLSTNCEQAASFLDRETDDDFVRLGVGALIGTVDPAQLKTRISSERDFKRLHVRAIALAKKKQYAMAAAALAVLRTEHSSYYFVRPDAQVLEALCLFEVNATEDAAMLTASLYAKSPRSVPPVQLRRFERLVCDESHECDKGNIAWPIIAVALRDAGFDDVSLDRIHDFVSDYTESQNCELPTELLDTLADIKLTPEQLVFFRDCCTTEIMESSIWIENQEQLLRERLALCESIRTKMDQPPVGIEGEIGILMRKLAVLDITQRIERSRIFVDIERIKDRLPQSFSDSTTSLLAAIALSNHDLNRSLKLLGMPNREGGKVLLLTVDRGEEAFKNIFERIREQYLYSPELGLDANLSQSIRHGPIISGIRSAFDRSRLITRKRAGTGGEYEPNKHWLATLAPSPSALVVVERAFSQLALGVDSFITQVRNEEIQIRSAEHPRGLLVYEFTDQELNAAFNKIQPLHDVEDVYDIIAETLVQRTENCLDRVKEAARDDWDARLVGLLQQFISQVESAMPDCSTLSLLRTAVTDCTTEVSRVLERIAGWFEQDDQRENKAFTIRSLVRTFEETAAKAGQHCSAVLTLGMAGGDCMVDGVYFRSLWDMFFILFDNALKHGGVDKTNVRVSVELKDGVTRFAVSNPVSADVDAEVLDEKIAQLNALSLDKTSDLVKLRSEGGSGIAKLHKIVRYEIGEDDSDYTIRLSLTNDPTPEFTVKIEIQKGIADASVCS